MKQHRTALRRDRVISKPTFQGIPEGDFVLFCGGPHAVFCPKRDISGLGWKTSTGATLLSSLTDCTRSKLRASRFFWFSGFLVFWFEWSGVDCLCSFMFLVFCVGATSGWGSPQCGAASSVMFMHWGHLGAPLLYLRHWAPMHDFLPGVLAASASFTPHLWERSPYHRIREKLELKRANCNDSSPQSFPFPFPPPPPNMFP